MDNGRQRLVLFHAVAVRGRSHALALLRFGNKSDSIELGQRSFYRVCRNLPAREISQRETTSSRDGKQAIADRN